MTEASFGIEELDRKYEILGKLGEGGMGEVHKVRHRLLEEVRVVKTIRAHLKERSEMQERFVREAKVATQLRHPGIAQTLDFGVGEDGTAFIVMEFVEGRDLRGLFDEGRTFSLRESLDISEQVLAVLDYLHGRKLVHRDISPDNIMLAAGPEGRPQARLIDLGIAKPLESSQGLTRTGLFVGKLRYASPEQLSDTGRGVLDPRSDLYSYGLVLYQLLTGAFPIVGDSESAVIAGHLFHPPRSFDETDPGGAVPAGLREVVMRALAKSPEERFESAAAFLAALSERAAAESFRSSRPAVPAAAPTPESPPVAEKTKLRAGPAGAGARGGALRRLAARRRLPLSVTAAAGVLLALLGLWYAGLFDGPPGGGEIDGGGRSEALAPPLSPRAGDGTGEPAGLAELDFGRYHALVIGNDAYRKLPRLETAAFDAREVAAILEEKYGYRVRLLTDATRYETMTALTEVTQGLGADDNLLIYYAGHGWLDPQNQSGYWQPIDAEPFNTANSISTKYEVSAVLNRLPARQILVVADSCYSGALSGTVEPQAAPPMAGPEQLRHVREMLTRRSRLALTSGGLSPVLDVGDGRHSVFSKVFLDVLARNDRVAGASRLFTELRRRVTEAARRFGVEQDPTLAPIPLAGDEGGDFFFVPTV